MFVMLHKWGRYTDDSSDITLLYVILRKSKIFNSIIRSEF